MNDDYRVDTSRRVFLKLVAVGAALPALAACGPAGVGPASFGDVSGGNIADLPVGSLRALDGQPVCIGRDKKGVYAMTLTCSHQGCNMAVQGQVSASGIYCACHGSRFDANGNVLSGPAPDALQHFEVTEDPAGELTVHGGSYVDASKRLAV